MVEVTVVRVSTHIIIICVVFGVSEYVLGSNLGAASGNTAVKSKTASSSSSSSSPFLFLPFYFYLNVSVARYFGVVAANSEPCASVDGGGRLFLSEGIAWAPTGTGAPSVETRRRATGWEYKVVLYVISRLRARGNYWCWGVRGMCEEGSRLSTA
ncbi:hypothetical protein QBC43DRAFT_334849 [Cladorrhinum sp. PSN259]|nr:hypothetical protein QBC43DRAFT_334849 [Cladorrhinum sp. PSN259]